MRLSANERGRRCQRSNCGFSQTILYSMVRSAIHLMCSTFSRHARVAFGVVRNIQISPKRLCCGGNHRLIRLAWQDGHLLHNILLTNMKEEE